MPAAVQNPTLAFDAVENQLKTLCLSEFPCGLGSWRETENVSKKTERSLKRLKKKLPPVYKTNVDPESLEGIKIQAQRDKSEVLQELVGSHFSPWHLDYSWSEEAKRLREIAVKSPWLIDEKFVLNYFKTLRIVDKNVTEVDANLLKFKNLEELTLTANYITNINSKNLPISLKVLELCANQISDVSGLCVRPPLLDHLGLGRNKILFMGDYITGDFWPNLLSLDLSHNDLCDLMDTVRKLLTLPKLRNLILQGNPLSLIPGYRGYTVDCLRRLSIMDDIHISADEKHHFKGLARRREFILDEAKVQIGITYIKGLPCPEEIKSPENQPEYPVVDRTYFLQFFFPEERGGKTEEVIADEVDLNEFAAIENEVAENNKQEHERDDEESEEHSVLRADSSITRSTENQVQTERNVQINSRPQMKSADAYSVTKTSAASFPRGHPNQTDPEVTAGSGVEGINLQLLEEGDEEAEEGNLATPDDNCPMLPSGVRLLPVNSEPQKWAEELELNWTVDLVRDDLLALRDFLKQGMDFNVVEQVVLGYPLEQDESSDKEKAADAKDGKEKRKSESIPPKGKKDKQKSKPATPQKTKKDAGGGKDKKKKKEPEVELMKSAPTFTTIASFHITLEQFLDGEFEYRNIFHKGDVPPPSTIRSMGSEDKKLEKKDSKDKKKSSPDKKKDSNSNAKDGKKSPRTSDKKGSKVKGHNEEAEDEDMPPPPLELEVTVKLHHWMTAMDSVKEEEERNSNLENTTSRTLQTNKSKEKL